MGRESKLGIVIYDKAVKSINSNSINSNDFLFNMNSTILMMLMFLIII